MEPCRLSVNNTMKNTNVGNADILLGRGGLTNNHTGNVAFRKLVSDHQDEYLQARKKEKILISRRIVGLVHTNGGRFLQRSPDGGEGWVEVSEQRAQQKTSQALREGLDVRNSTVREPKQSSSKRAAADSDESISSNEAQAEPRKRQKTVVVHGKVKSLQPSSSSSQSSSIENSPSFFLGKNEGGGGGGSSSVHSIPALRDEINHYANAPSFVLYQPQLSKSEVTDACEV